MLPGLFLSSKSFSFYIVGSWSRCCFVLDQNAIGTNSFRIDKAPGMACVNETLMSDICTRFDATLKNNSIFFSDTRWTFDIECCRILWMCATIAVCCYIETWFIIFFSSSFHDFPSLRIDQPR